MHRSMQLPTHATDARYGRSIYSDTKMNPCRSLAPTGAHDDFDWSVDKRNVTSYTKEEKEKYDKVYDNTFVQLK